MASVTQRIRMIKQPFGGYINPKLFSKELLNDNKETKSLYPAENIHASLIGLTVDYLTRTIISQNPVLSFNISIRGASLIGEEIRAINKAMLVNNLEDEAITLACQLAGYDVLFRAGPTYYKPVDEIIPDSNTIENIRIMVKRSLAFFQKYGPVISEGFTFSGGYTDVVDAGDGDFITKDTLWDFKVLSSEPTKDHTLQLIMYLLMGKRSVHKEFNNIKKIGIFNPRKNIVYTLNIEIIPKEIIEEIEKKVIGY